jgi:hypothetical protein
MDLGRLALASEVTGSEDIPYHFRKIMVCQFKSFGPKSVEKSSAKWCHLEFSCQLQTSFLAGFWGEKRQNRMSSFGDLGRFF